MGVCIYSGFNKDDSFKSAEHIVPAFLGGKRKLPKGYVSDKVNNYFSGLEYQLSHNSGLSFIRSFFGPGKRGIREYESYPLIAYTTAGQSYLVKKSNDRLSILDQLVITFDNDGYSIIFYGSQEENLINNPKQALKFHQMFVNKADTNSTIYIQDVISSKDRYVISFYKEKWYVASNTKIQIVELKSKINNSAMNPYSDKYMQRPIGEELSIGKVCEDSTASRKALSKIVFNTYALLYGKEAALSKKFQTLINYIMDTGDSKYPDPNVQVVIDVRRFIEKNKLQPDCHLIIVFTFKDKLYGTALFYGGQYTFSLVLSEEITIEEPLKIFSCEWKTGTEKVFSAIDFDYEKLILDPIKANKIELLSNYKSFGRILTEEAVSSINSVLCKLKDVEIQIYLDFDSIHFYSQVEMDVLNFKINVHLNFLLSDYDFNNVIVQNMVYIQLHYYQLIQIARSVHIDFPGEELIASNMNFITSFGVQDINSKLYNYDVEMLYSSRFSQLVTRIINYPENMFSDDFMKARLSIELAIIMLYNGDYEDEFKLLIGQKNISILNNAREIVNRCSKITPGDMIERIKAIKDVIKLLDVSEHVKVAGY